ncbi:MAG: ferredoxin--NADP reductase [Planctomycetes bacterium]|nr:ferredoxin--NADP reductase [Planctomycetota bacterium]
MELGLPNATLVERRDVTASLARFFVVPDREPWTSFEPGQFTNLGLLDTETPEIPTRLVRRAYSLVSTPGVLPLEFYVRRVRGGSLSERLFALRPGARLWLDERVYGRLTCEPLPPERAALFVASGTGVAPFMSMLRAYASAGRWTRAVLVESVREASEFGYRDELEALARERSEFTWLPTVTGGGEHDGWIGRRGRIQTWLEPASFAASTRVALRPDALHAFLCGNPEMIEAVGGLLGELGFRPHSRRAPGEVHVERYW